ncbi:MAG: YDG domain-containing protein [Rickettsiales bacterium]
MLRINKKSSNLNISKAVLYLTTCLSSFAFALPENPEVKAGNVSFNQSDSELHIHQQTEKAIIDWRGFDINQGELTKFHQPSSSSIALNRVISDNPSQINGMLQANGNIVIINQNGILFGKNAVVDVNGLIASTMDIDNNQFMNSANKLEFNKLGKVDAGIINEGKITAKEAGLVGLVAPQVTNNGVIVANSGSVQLASGDSFTVDMYGDKLLEVSVSGTLKKQLIENNGLIEASGGKIILTAAAGKEIIDNLIIVKGELKSPTVAQKNGEIIIYAEGSNAVKDNITENKGKKTGASKVEVTAKLDVSGTKAGEKAGKVLITGDEVTIHKGSLIFASGYDGKSDTTKNKAKSSIREGSAGGEILLGGDYLGRGTTPTANNLTIEPGAWIVSDAINSGDAGRTILWSDDTTKFYGVVLSRALGGKGVNLQTFDAIKDGNWGNGGFVETSGHKHLDHSGYINLTASNGSTGTNFLDPNNITIYGNVNPKYTSTDGSINLSNSLKLWLDASNLSSVQLSYINTSVTATGTMGSSNITINDAASPAFTVGNQIRLSSSSLLDDASVINDDTYIITAKSDSTITLSRPLTKAYPAGTPIYIGYASSWTDESGNSYNATQNTSSSRPLYLVNQQNGNPILKFDGSSDGFNVYLGFLNDPSNGYNGIAHTNFVSAKTTQYGSFYQSSSNGGNFYEGFNTDGNYRLDYMLGNDVLSVTPSLAFSAENYNVITYQWLPDSPHGADYALNTKNIYANTNLEAAVGYAGTLGSYQGSANIGNGDSVTLWGGSMSEIMMYTAYLSTDTINLLNQYQSAKWDITLAPPGSGSSEAAKAMASRSRSETDGYNSFTTGYLERLSKTANIDLQADSSITLDFKGDTLRLADDKSFSLTTNGDIIAVSSGKIHTKGVSSGGNININAGGNLDVSKLVLQADNNGAISLTSGSGGGGDGLIFNPNISAGGGVNFQILTDYTPKGALSLSGLAAANKVYDGTASATLTGTAAVAGASVSGTPVGTFADKNVGSGKSVTLSDLSIYVSAPGSYTYNSLSSFSADVIAATLSVGGLSASSKTYDTTTDATILGTPTASPLAGDIVNVEGIASGAFANKNVGSNKEVTLSGLSLSGDDANNYNIALPSLTADVTAVTLSVGGLSASSKTYDATTDATILGTPTASPLAGDIVNVEGIASGAFANKNVGSNKNITLSGLSLGGDDSSNYNIDLPSLSADITPAPLKVVVDNITIIYNEPRPSISYTYTGVMEEDKNQEILSGEPSIEDRNEIGDYQINQGTLEANENYEIETFIPGIFSIKAPSIGRIPISISNAIKSNVLRFNFSSIPNKFTASILNIEPPMITLDSLN